MEFPGLLDPEIIAVGEIDRAGMGFGRRRFELSVGADDHRPRYRGRNPDALLAPGVKVEIAAVSPHLVGDEVCGALDPLHDRGDLLTEGDRKIAAFRTGVDDRGL